MFPSRGGRPLSENGQRNAIHRMGFQATAHGLRATASSVLQELGYDDTLIKLALSHDKDKTSAAYLRSPLVQARREMLQHLADYLDGLGSKLAWASAKPGARLRRYFASFTASRTSRPATVSATCSTIACTCSGRCN